MRPTTQECLDVTMVMLRRAGIAAAAWHALRPALKRAAVARALGTQDSRLIDMAVRMADLCLPRATGAVTAEAAGMGMMLTLGVIGGAILGGVATIALQRARVAEMEAAEYEARVDNAESDWRRYHQRYATIAEIETGAYPGYVL